MMSKRRGDHNFEKDLWRLIVSFGSVSRALRDLEIIESFSNADGMFDQDVYEALWCSFFVSYAKSFLNNDGIGKFPLKVIPKEKRKFYDKIIRIRNAAFGHIDPNAKTNNGSQINRVTITVVDGKILPRPQGIIPTVREWAKFMDHTQDVYDSIGSALAKFFTDNPQIDLKLDGDYILDWTLGETERLRRVEDRDS